MLEQPVLHETSHIGDLPEPQLVSRPSFRSRNRPVISWGPPPVAAYNMTQLPFKIDETPSKSTTRCQQDGATPETTTNTERAATPPNVGFVDDSNESDEDDDDETDEGLVMTMHNSNGVEIVEESNEL